MPRRPELLRATERSEQILTVEIPRQFHALMSRRELAAEGRPWEAVEREALVQQTDRRLSAALEQPRLENGRGDVHAAGGLGRRRVDLGMRAPGGPAFGALLLQGKVEVKDGAVHLRRGRQPDEPEPPVWGRVALTEEAVRGDLPLVGSFTLSREEVLQAQLGGLGLELGASPIRVALWPNVGSMSLRVRLTQEEP